MKYSDKLLISGDVVFYKDKAPFRKSGKSVLGALEYDDALDLIKCHECGVWKRALGPHVYREHGMSGEAYKLKHGLRMTSALVAEGTRVKMLLGYSANSMKNLRKNLKHRKKKRKRHGGVPEWQNRNRLCQDQILERIKKVAGIVGHTPTELELREHGLHYRTVKFRFGSLKKAIQLAGLTPRPKRNSGGRSPNANSPTRAQLIAELKNFAALHGRSPMNSDVRRGLLPSMWHYKQKFGFWNKALLAAGLRLNPTGRRKKYL